MDVRDYLRKERGDRGEIPVHARSNLGVRDWGDDLLIMPRIGIGHGDALFLEWVFSRRPALTNIVELGTGTGLTSLYLGMMARVRGGQFHTFDHVDRRPDWVLRAWLPEMTFHQVDLSVSGGEGYALERVGLENTLLFVDDGYTDPQRAMSIRTYCEVLQPGSVFVVHDWDPELYPQYVVDIPSFDSFMEFGTEMAEMLCSCCRSCAIVLGGMYWLLYTVVISMMVVMALGLAEVPIQTTICPDGILVFCLSCLAYGLYPLCLFRREAKAAWARAHPDGV